VGSRSRLQKNSSKIRSFSPCSAVDQFALANSPFAAALGTFRQLMLTQGAKGIVASVIDAPDRQPSRATP
jgi:hypothetical protein